MYYRREKTFENNGNRRRSINISNHKFEVPKFATILVVITSYLVFGTGINSDDYALILTFRTLTASQMLWPTASSIGTPLTHFTHAWFYYFFGDGSPFLYDGIKTAYLLLSLHCLRRFFSLWFDENKSIAIAILLVFYPVHDAVTYWFIGQYLLLSLSLLTYSFYLLESQRVIKGFTVGLAGSFISYGSSAVAFGLAMIFIARRDFRRAILMLLPNVIYIAYYLTVTVLLGRGVARVPLSWDMQKFAKQLILQVLTFFDSAIGPSFWLKMTLALGEISALSVMIAGAVIYFVYRLPWANRRNAGVGGLLLGALGVAVAAMVMFAITGLYPQIAFNLGDRVTIFGNFLIVILIASLPLRRLQWVGVLAVYILVSFGISDHWKSWQYQQQAVIQDIRENTALQSIPEGQVLFVTGNQYSHFGGISHIEFLSEDFLAQAVFAFSSKTAFPHQIFSLNQRFRFDGGLLIDRKYGISRPAWESILIYDSISNELIRLPVNDINRYLDALPTERRSWVQLLGDGRIRGAILYLMPRLRYAF